MTIPESQLDCMWTKKRSNVEPGPSTSTGTPKKRREDDFNEFIEIEDTEESRRSDLRNDDTWMRGRENNEKWEEAEKEYTTTSRQQKQKHTIINAP